MTWERVDMSRVSLRGTLGEGQHVVSNLFLGDRGLYKGGEVGLCEYRRYWYRAVNPIRTIHRDPIEYTLVVTDYR